MSMLISLFWHAPVIGKVVLLTLLSVSIAACGILFFIMAIHRERKKELLKSAQALSTVTNFDELLKMSSSLHESELGFIVARILSSLKLAMQKGDVVRSTINTTDMELIHETADQAVLELQAHQRRYLKVLLALAELSPLLGLFGTVGGLINAFLKIADQQSADIATVAPGIAEALVTTLAGLFATMIAVAAYHICSYMINAFEHLLYDKTQRVFLIINKTFLG